MTDLNETLYRLLHHRSFRKAFLELQTIDVEQLEAAGERVAQKLLNGNHQGGQGLSHVFSDSFELWKIQTGKPKLELVYEFLESSYFEEAKDLPYAGIGEGLEEAFYKFLVNDVWTPNHPFEGIARNEYMIKLFTTLASNERPNFKINSEFVKQNKLCKYSVQIFKYRFKENQLIEEPHYIMYAAVGGKIISGEITPLIADILFYQDRSPQQVMGEMIQRHKVSFATYIQTSRSLAEIGLIAI